MIRVAVTGGRNYWGKDRVFEELDAINRLRGISLVMHGACKDLASGELCGADRWAGEWSVEVLDEDAQRYPAHWSRYGSAAGPIRNRQMLTDGKPDLLVAFPGGTGTAGCVKIARELGIEVLEVK